MENTLSRKEMRAIKGGYLFGYHCVSQPYAEANRCCRYTFGISHSCDPSTN